MAADPDPLAGLLRATSADERDELKMQLLSELHRGRPVGDLVPLLTSGDPKAVEAGIWIASELGALGEPLLPTIIPLLDHVDPTVRFFALDGVLLWASATDGAALARAVQLIDDPSAAVRWKAMRFLWRASPAQLDAARAALTPSRQAQLVAWLLEPSQVTERLASRDALERRYAAVAAARVTGSDRGPLDAAAHSDDADVRDFVADLGLSRP